MGILSILLKGNNAEGIRETVKLNYKRATNHTFLFDIDEKLHQRGMMIALKSRYLSLGKDMPAEVLAVELSPFFLIPSQEIAIDAFCEYIVYKEKTIDAKVEGLKTVLNEILSMQNNNPWYLVSANAIVHTKSIPWINLIKESTRAILKDALEKSKDTKNASINLPGTVLRNNITSLYYFIFYYDNDGREIKHEYFDANNNMLWYETKEYDNSGKLLYLNKCNSNGLILHKSLHEYRDGNLIRIDDGDEEYEYDTNGLMMKRSYKISEDEIQTVLFEYDSKGRKTKETHHQSDGTPYTPTIYEYGPNDRLMRMITLNEDGSYGSISNYQYNDNGQETGSYQINENSEIVTQYMNEYDNNLLTKRFFISFD